MNINVPRNIPRTPTKEPFLATIVSVVSGVSVKVRVCGRKRKAPAFIDEGTIRRKSERIHARPKSKEDGGTKLYCICRRPYDPWRFMIGCDVCDGWFHARCVNITAAEAESMKKYTCPNCRKKRKAPRRNGVSLNSNSKGEYVWDSQFVDFTPRKLSNLSLNDVYSSGTDYSSVELTSDEEENHDIQRCDVTEIVTDSTEEKTPSKGKPTAFIKPQIKSRFIKEFDNDDFGTDNEELMDRDPFERDLGLICHMKKRQKQIETNLTALQLFKRHYAESVAFAARSSISLPEFHEIYFPRRKCPPLNLRDETAWAHTLECPGCHGLIPSQGVSIHLLNCSVQVDAEENLFKIPFSLEDQPCEPIICGFPSLFLEDSDLQTYLTIREVSTTNTKPDSKTKASCETERGGSGLPDESGIDEVTRKCTEKDVSFDDSVFKVASAVARTFGAKEKDILDKLDGSFCNDLTRECSIHAGWRTVVKAQLLHEEKHQKRRLAILESEIMYVKNRMRERGEQEKKSQEILHKMDEDEERTNTSNALEISDHNRIEQEQSEQKQTKKQRLVVFKLQPEKDSAAEKETSYSNGHTEKNDNKLTRVGGHHSDTDPQTASSSFEVSDNSDKQQSVRRPPTRAPRSIVDSKFTEDTFTKNVSQSGSTVLQSSPSASTTSENSLKSSSPSSASSIMSSNSHENSFTTSPNHDVSTSSSHTIHSSSSSSGSTRQSPDVPQAGIPHQLLMGTAGYPPNLPYVNAIPYGGSQLMFNPQAMAAAVGLQRQQIQTFGSDSQACQVVPNSMIATVPLNQSQVAFANGMGMSLPGVLTSHTGHSHSSVHSGASGDQLSGSGAIGSSGISSNESNSDNGGGSMSGTSGGSFGNSMSNAGAAVYTNSGTLRGATGYGSGITLQQLQQHQIHLQRQQQLQQQQFHNHQRQRHSLMYGIQRLDQQE